VESHTGQTHGSGRQAVGVDVGGTKILAGVVAEDGTIVRSRERATPDGTEDALVATLEDAGITVLERAAHVVELDGCEVGIVGLKGFVGGFPGSSLPDFGEPLLREVYRQTSDDVAALDEGLREIAHCPYRIVLLHYSPCAETLRGEPEGIWAFLGNERIAAPIREHEPDLVLHGHAHIGTFEAKIGASPVYNVSVPVMGRDFWVLELASLRTPTSPLH